MRSFKNNGFTIVELLVVIVVIGVLASISLVAYTGISKKANEAAVTSDLSNSFTQFKLFQVENSKYPDDVETNCVTPVNPANKCVKLSNGNELGIYYAVHTQGAQTFCLTIKKGNNIVKSITNEKTYDNVACSYPFPVALTATAFSRNRIDLTWPTVTGADSLTLQRDTDSAFTEGHYTTLAAPAASATSASSTGLTSSTQYFYRMKMTKGGDDSNWSTPVSATTQAFTFPVTLAANSPVPTRNTISLSWPTVTGADSLTLQRATNNTFTTGLTTLTAPAAAATSASSTGLTALTAYYYRMSVTMGGETSNWSNTASNTTLDFPGPTGLAMTSKTTDSISLSWAAVTGAVNYTLRRSSTADFASYVDATTASGTVVYTSSGLTAGTYYYKVNVIDAGGTSAWSSPITASTQLTQDFAYTGAAQSWTVPASITSVTIEVWGAQGGYLNGGGKGGYAKGNLAVNAGDTLYIYTGGLGGNYAAGFNSGGGTGRGGGGGASDVRYGSNTLAGRKIVAGGGGGRSLYGSGGVGGGTSGLDAADATYGGKGGTQTAGGAKGASGAANGNGSLGLGGAGESFHDGGMGGGGYYGGGGGGNSFNGTTGGGYGGGGGSGYIGGVTGATTIAGDATMPNPAGGTMTGNTGDGYVRITY